MVPLGWLSLQGAQPKAGFKHPGSCADEVLAKPEQDNAPAAGLQFCERREILQDPAEMDPVPLLLLGA